MIEVIYKEEKPEENGEKALLAIPRNIRQIGLVKGNYRIYVEDYVYTFLTRMASSEKTQKSGGGCTAVLTGEIKWQEGTTYVFVKGALGLEQMEAAADHIDFSECVWADIYQEKEKYFPEQEIVGWFFAQPQVPAIPTELYTRTHLKNFGGEKVLMLMEPTEREEAFFCYENGGLMRQSGYYIYYEKNTLMQTYMIEKNGENRQEPEEQPSDEAVKNFRRIIEGKKKQKVQEPEEHASVFSYAATACLVIAVLTVGASFYRNYQEAVLTGKYMQAAFAPAEEETEPGSDTTVTFTPQPVLTRVPTVTPTPEETVILTETPSSPSTAETGNLTEEAGGDEIYREESDIRKAKRREALEGDMAKENVQAAEGTVTGTTTAAAAAETQGNTVHESYVIRPGDTLYQISMEHYGTMNEIEEICRLNGISQEEIIYPGQVIVLP